MIAIMHKCLISMLNIMSSFHVRVKTNTIEYDNVYLREYEAIFIGLLN